MTDTESSPCGIDAAADAETKGAAAVEGCPEQGHAASPVLTSIEHGIATRITQHEESQRSSYGEAKTQEAVDSRPPAWAEHLFSELRHLRERVDLEASLRAQTVKQQRRDQERRDIAHHNGACFREYSANHLDIPLRPITKRTPGIGAPIPQCRLDHGCQQGHEELELAVGDEVLVFPKSPAELFHSWTFAKINRLAMLLNNDLGINEGDDLRTCRLKTAFFLSNP